MHQRKLMMAIGVMAVAVGIIGYLNQPLDTSYRVAQSMDALNNGSLTEAVDELENETKGDKIADEIGDIVSPSPQDFPPPAVRQGTE